MRTKHCQVLFIEEIAGGNDTDGIYRTVDVMVSLPFVFAYFWYSVNPAISS